MATKLTSLSHGAGCGCKIGAADLREIVRRLPPQNDEALIVGTELADDAGVYRVRDDFALVQTVDFFTPIVDDPYDFGRIAAANALSDVYAMGGTPLTALNLIAYSLEELGRDALAEILRGGADTAAEAGVAVVGGHSIDDREPKYGMAVTGWVHPDRVVRNSTARAGDALFLTKPLGVGVVATALKRDAADPKLLEAATRVMTTLNRSAAGAALEVGPSAMTDVTGFGLLGHLHELALASGVAAEVRAADVPLIDGVAELAAIGDFVAGGTRGNQEFVEPWAAYDDSVSAAQRILLADATTSGGLLVAVAQDRAGDLAAALSAAGCAAAAEIGRLVDGEPGAIRILERNP